MEQPTELNNQILHKECNDFTKAMIYQFDKNDWVIASW